MHSNLALMSLDEAHNCQSRQWEAVVFEGAWVAGVSAGGCRNNLQTFAMNPQYLLTLIDHDEEDDEDLCTLIVALMQKNHRSKRKMGLDSLTIGFAIYKLEDNQFQLISEESGSHVRHQMLTTDFFKFNASVARSPTFINLREMTARFRLPPGMASICVMFFSH